MGLQCLAAPTFEFSEPHMGTTFRIVLYAADEATAKKAAKAAFARVAELNAIMSDYQPTSELMKLCEKAGGEPVQVSADLFKISRSEEDGEADRRRLRCQHRPGGSSLATGPADGELPKAEEIKKALALVDYRKISSIRKAARCSYSWSACCSIWAALPRATLRMRRWRSCGGTASRGPWWRPAATSRSATRRPMRKGWKIGVAPLKNPDAAANALLLLKNAGVSTAGDSEQYVEDRRQALLAHRRSEDGLSVWSAAASVTVIAPNATTSDGLDTGFCVLGVERELEDRRERADIAALFVFETDKGIETTMSKRFARFLWKD